MRDPIRGSASGTSSLPGQDLDRPWVGMSDEEELRRIGQFDGIGEVLIDEHNDDDRDALGLGVDPGIK